MVDDMTAAPVEVIGSNRGGVEATTRSVSQVMNIPTDRVRWGPIWAGLLAAFFSLLVLSLLGLAIGALTVNAGQAVSGGGGNQNAGQYSAI